MVKERIRADLPPLYNSRAEQHWQIISRKVDFAGKAVIDLGVGYGDLSLRAARAGARVHGVDKEVHNFVRRANSVGLLDRIKAIDSQLPRMPENLAHYHIAMCFSVLPYLTEPEKMLRWMRNNADISLIECQYFGDGPGLEKIKDNDDMMWWLDSIGWKHIEPIGKTHIVNRNKYRTIWMCQ